MSPAATDGKVGPDTELIERAALFLWPLLVFWITLPPLTDLSSDAVLQPSEVGDLFSQILFVGLSAPPAAKLLSLGWRRALPLAFSAYFMMVGWLAERRLAS